jgi:hypothetical protein
MGYCKSSRNAFVILVGVLAAPTLAKAPHHVHDTGGLTFDVKSVKSGKWSATDTWDVKRVPKAGERVRISRDTRVEYDVESQDVIRLIQVVGTLSFARDRNTLLNVGLVKVQNSDTCSESGFVCDLDAVSSTGEPTAAPGGKMPALEVGTLAEPIPAQFSARIRLHYVPGMDKDDAPGLACCAARMDFHGAPMNRTWVDLAADVAPESDRVVLSDDVTGWRVGDEVIVTASQHLDGLSGSLRRNQDKLHTEERRIVKIEDRVITLDHPLKHRHFGSGNRRSEVANLSRNVIVESADPSGVRGHTVYHCYSRGSISYARFAHLGKEGVLGRYAIHFHLLGDTNRGGQVLGAAIVDSHNRWVTVHGTNYMVVRDCVGYRSVGHGFFLEDGSETYTVLDRNLGVQAYKGKRLPKQVLAFDPNDGAAYWWANGRNTFVRNTSCENDEYGFRYDSQKRSNSDTGMPVLQPDGKEVKTDIRTIPIYRFEDNEAHSEGLYGMVIAGTDRAAPDRRHPHVLKNLRIWQVHYGLRPQVPAMWMESIDIDHAVYGIYRPEFENHVYRDLRISATSSEPFNRGLDDESKQHGVITVDGLTFADVQYGGIPLIQMSDNNPSGKAASHFRNVQLIDRRDRNRRALVDRGGGAEIDPETPTSVPVFLHDYFGPGRHAKVVSTAAQDFSKQDQAYRQEKPLTGEESRVSEVRNVTFPTLLEPVDDTPPATIITSPASAMTVKREGESLIVRGTTTDNVRTKRVWVNGVEARDSDYNFHRWEVTLSGVKPGPLDLVAHAEDEAGNIEINRHKLSVVVE